MLDIKKCMEDARYWAHTKEGKPQETLEQHSRLCLQYYDVYCKEKGIDKLVKRIIQACGCNEEEVAVIYSMFVDAVYWHDIGKINSAYQRKVLKNTQFSNTYNSSNHANLSAYIYLREHLADFPKSNRIKFSYFLYSFSYCIARHHGYLKDIGDFTEKIQNCIEADEYYDQMRYLEKNSIYTSEKGYEQLKGIIADETAFYILNKMLFAVLTACDYCATSEYMSGTAVEFNTIKNLLELKQKYQNGKIYTSIRKYKEDETIYANSINAQRCQMFLESEINLIANPRACLYYLEAPTGSGKTNMSINLLLNMLEKNRELNNVFYIFPFNTLVEQTAQVLGEYFIYGQDMTVVNSITPIYMKKGEEGLASFEYELAALNRSLNNYPFVITSHVNFFNALFGTGREQCFPLLKLCNSVIIIDEIQSYRNNIWRQIILFLLQYAKLLNMKIIIMSATLPKLDLLLDGHEYPIVNLIKDPQVYYQNSFFKNRVELDFSLLAHKKIDLEILREKVLKYKEKKVLVEFISKTTAREFFNMLCLCDDVYCVEITGDDNAHNRKTIIEEIKVKEKIIVVATQVIEAGVDIDMDIGFKDISLPDAEEQFLGRINRSCLKSDCKAYFFTYDDVRVIYREDERVNYPVTEPHIAEMLRQKDFAGIYQLILRDVKNKSESKNINHIHYTYANCLELNYQKIEQKMRLIEPTEQIFLAYKLPIEDTMIDGKEVWERYKMLCCNKELGYGQKRVELSKLAEEMSYFTYTVYNSKERTVSCDEQFGGYYYIENGDQFIENGKFDRKAFRNFTEGLFL